MCRNYRDDQLGAIAAQDVEQMIKAARLSSVDREIATMRLIDCCDYADIAAAVNMDRSAVSKRLRKIIIPRIKDCAEQ